MLSFYFFGNQKALRRRIGWELLYIYVMNKKTPILTQTRTYFGPTDRILSGQGFPFANSKK